MTVTLQQEVDRLYVESGGQLEPSLLVEEARPPESPLHDYFNWDVAYNAEQHLLTQARRLIRSIKITRVAQTSIPAAVSGQIQREYVSIPSQVTPGQRYYVRTVDALASPIMREQLLGDLRRALESLRHRYGHLEEFSQIVEEFLPEKEPV